MSTNSSATTPDSPIRKSLPLRLAPTLHDWLLSETNRLEKSGITTARLDCLVLLSDELGKDKAYLLAHPEQELLHEQQERLYKKVMQRAAGRPLAYVRGKVEFYGREFMVNKHVLVPRPESETIITLLKTLPLATKVRIADIGCGSGCLGIIAGKEIAKSHIDMYDLSSQALAVANHNARTHKVKARYFQGNLLECDSGPYQVLLANLPYVPQRYPINKAAQFEPPVALFAGTDGLDLYRELFEQLAAKSWHPDFLLTESLPKQHPALAKLAQDNNFILLSSEDFIQVFKPASSS